MTHQELFSSSMQEASDMLDQLIQVLQEERDSLAQNNTALTQTILERKTQLLANLEKNAQQRNQLLQSEGFPADENGTQAFFKSLTQSAAKACADKWRNLEQKLENCKVENLINGKIIHRSRQQVDVLLNLIQGNKNSGRIYTQSGQAKSVNAQQPLAKV